MSRKKGNKDVKARSIPPLGPPERPLRPSLPPGWPYPTAPLPEDEVRRILGDIQKRLDSIELRLDRIEKLLSGKK